LAVGKREGIQPAGDLRAQILDLGEGQLLREGGVAAGGQGGGPRRKRSNSINTSRSPMRQALSSSVGAIRS
jgi:hypothetical protein